MLDVTYGTAYSNTIRLDSDPDASNVYQIWYTLMHEWGEVIVEETNASRINSGVFRATFSADTLNACGVYKIKWRYIISGNEYVEYVHFNVYQPYITSSQFFNNHPELETSFGDTFDNYEKIVRRIIDTYCGQKFEFYQDKTLELDGQGTRSLYLPLRLITLSTFKLYDNSPNVPTTETDFTPYVEKSPESDRAIRLKNAGATLSKDAYVKIHGDWGWPYVPRNIETAADILIADRMNDDSNYRQHGVRLVHMDQYRLEMFDGYQGSTGNLDADVLLMDYTLFTLGWV